MGDSASPFFHFYADQLSEEDSDQLLPSILSSEEGEESVEEEEEYLEQEQEDDLEEEEEDLLTCNNCWRKQIRNLHGLDREIYELQFTSHIRKNLIGRRKYRTVAVTTKGPTANDEIILCHQCTEFLSNKEYKECRAFENVWPGFIWKVLSNKDILDAEVDHPWCLLPIEWRRWWIDSFKDLVDSRVTLDYPSPYFVDKSLD